MATVPVLSPSPVSDDDYIRPAHSTWMDVDWREHQRWVTVEGRRVNLVDMGEGPEVVFVHGLAGSWQNWLENIPHFARSHRAIALDLPGFGHSEMPAEDLTISGYARTLDGVLEALGIERAAVVGNSMGGFVGADLAIAFPHRVDRLVLVAAAVMWNERRRARPLVTLARVTEAGAAMAMAQWELAARRPRLRAMTMSQVVRHPRRLPPELAYELMRRVGPPEAFAAALEALYSYRLRDRLPEIECPTLVVWGERDQLVPVSQAHTIADLIPDARVEVFEDTGHVPMLERPTRFNALVDEFLAQ
jgi:pimeloyl-ACP methyl ester carboxylesterase